jgi:hypothetical protein
VAAVDNLHHWLIAGLAVDIVIPKAIGQSWCVVWCCGALCYVQMYCLLIRVEAGPEPNLWSYLVTNIVFLVGFFTLAVLLGEQQTPHHHTQ